MWWLPIIFVLAELAMAQSVLPDAPTPQPGPLPSRGWALWNGKETRSNWEILKDPKFKWFAIGQVGLAVADAEVTKAGLGRHRCVERNTDLPMHPSRGELYRNFALTDGSIIALGFLIQKTIPRGKLTTTEKVASWTYPVMAVYGMQMHARGVVSWFDNCW